MLSFGNKLSAQAIGLNNATPDASSILDMVATNRGVLVPRMLAAQKAAIVSPANGLLIYQTDGVAGFYYNAGTPGVPNWVPFITPTTGWLVGGNSPGVSSILGTLDNSAMTIQTGSGALNIGTDAVAKTITLGNLTGATTTNIKSGTVGVLINDATAANTPVKIATGSTTGQVNIGNTTGKVSIAQTIAPLTSLDVNGAYSARYTSAAPAAAVAIPANVSLFRLTLAAGGGTANALSVAAPADGQYLTIANLDDDAATFATYTIPVTTGVSTFVYDGTSATWRLISTNSGIGIRWDQLINPSANLTLSHGTNITTMNFANTTTTAFAINNTALTTGTGLAITSSNSAATGNAFITSSNSTGASVNGIARFNFSAVHTGNGLQIDDATASGTALALNVNGLGAGTGLAITSSNLTTTGNLFAVTSSTGFPSAAGIARFNFTGTHSGNGLQIDDATNVGTVQSITASALTTGTGLSITSSNAASVGNAFITSSNSTGLATNGIARFNFTGAHTGNGLQIDDATTTGIAQSITANLLTTGTGLNITSTSAITTGSLFNANHTTGIIANAGGSVARITSSAANTAGSVLYVNASGASTSGTNGVAVISNSGTGLGLRVNDDGTDTDATPVVVDATGKVGMGTATPNGALHIFETTGTTLSPTAASLILEHGNSGGQSSILFKSTVNTGSDYGYIQYIDDGSTNPAGSTGENGLLEIGIQNDGPNVSLPNVDDIAIMSSGNVGIGTRGPSSFLHVVQPAITAAGAFTGFTFTGGAHTALSASTEVPDVKFDFARTVTFAAGAKTLQAAMLITPPTYAFSGATTVTNPATVRITGPPVAGANATFTTPNIALDVRGTIIGAIPVVAYSFNNDDKDNGDDQYLGLMAASKPSTNEVWIRVTTTKDISMANIDATGSYSAWINFGSPTGSVVAPYIIALTCTAMITRDDQNECTAVLVARMSDGTCYIRSTNSGATSALNLQNTANWSAWISFSSPGM
jgi:hypothetical protein